MSETNIRNRFRKKILISETCVSKIFKEMYQRIKLYQNAAAAKSLQSCPTLCDPIDGSPPAFPIPGIQNK